MSIRIDASTDRIFRTATVPSSDPITMMCWLYLAADRNALGSIMYVTDGVANALSVQLASDGTTLQCNTIISNVSNVVSGSSLSIGRWYHIARVRSGSLQQVYLDGVLNASESRANSVSTARIEAMNDLANQWVNGRIFNFQVFNEAFTQEKIVAHMLQKKPPQFNNMWSWWLIPPSTDARAVDYSGNGRTLSVSGTLTDEDDPPIPWELFNTPYTDEPFVFEMEGFRWRNDDGSESGATWRQNQDVDDQVARNANIRLRTLVNAVVDEPSRDFKLQYRKSGEEQWEDVEV